MKSNLGNIEMLNWVVTPVQEVVLAPAAEELEGVLE